MIAETKLIEVAEYVANVINGATNRMLLKHLTASAITLCFGVIFSFTPSNSQAGTPLDAWRIEISRVRSLAENDAFRAHDNALHLQATLPSDATPADRSRILNLLARIEIYLAQTEQAETHANQALVLAKQNEDRIGQVEANLNIALNPINEVKIDDQFASTIQSMELLRELDRPDLLVEAMLRTVMMDRRSGHSVDSIQTSKKAMEIAERSSTPIAMAYAYQGLAISYDQRGKEKEAGEQYTHMLEQARKVPSKVLEADALMGLGGLAIYGGDIGTGEEHIREAIALYRSVGGSLYASGKISVLADILLQHSRPAAALPLFDEAIATQEHYGNKKELWWELTARSQTRQALGQLAAAQADAERSYLLAKEFRVPPYISESAKRLSSIAAARGDFSQAYRFFVEASEAASRAERERVNTRMFELAKRYQSENQQINELNRLNKQQAAELKQNELQQRWLWTVLGGSLMMLAGIAYFLLRLRLSHRQLEDANMQVQQSQNKLQATLDAIPDLLFELGMDGRYYDYHSPRTDLLLAPAEVLLGQTVSEVMPPSAAEVCLLALREANETGVSIGKQFELEFPHGKLWFELSIARKSVGPGEEPRFIVLSRDITARKAAERKIENLAFYDPLTDLPNRRLLLDRLQHALASSVRSGKVGALLLIDIDNFKALNDTLGHGMGDLLLQQAAQRLMSCVREGDTVARFGGDEFVVLLENLSEHIFEAAEQTEIVGKKILTTLSQPYRLAEHEFLSTSSAGATQFIGSQHSIEELLKQADISMYQAKKVGRNTLRFFDQQMQDAVNAHAALERELRTALAEHQFQLYYQIQVDDQFHAFAAEALIRWVHPERGLVAPDQFIPLAEETGMILPIGRWVIETACNQINAWQQDVLTRDLNLAINVSAKEFHQADFVAQVHAVVQRHAINPNRLKLELTESMLLENIEDTITTMHALKKIGICLSLDDFGTGYSSLQYLKHLPLDQLKIDQSFVRDIVNDSSDRAIVRTIIAMAESLNLKVIAEGVETEEQRQLLLSKGCTNYQGYLIGKPMPIEQFEALLKQS